MLYSGLADSNALPQAVSAYHACKFIGMPECEVQFKIIVSDIVIIFLFFLAQSFTSCYIHG